MKITRNMRIGIIGGKGRTGRQFAKFFQNHGFQVVVTDKKTHNRTRTLFETCDIVLFSVPLQGSVKIMREEITHAVRKDQLILDVSSLKTEQVASMLRGKGEVIGMHPMFGPKTQAAGQTVILCPGRCGRETLQSLRRLLRAMGMRTTIVSPEAHDRLMVFVQALPHLKSLLVAAALDALGADLDRIDTVSPLTYEMELNLVGRFLDDDPLLYGPIIFGNRDSGKIIETLRKLLGNFSTICKTQDYSRFSKHYRTLQRRFGAARLSRARGRSETAIRAITTLPRS